MVIGCLMTIHPQALAIDGFVKVLSPSGGETFTEGQAMTITWDSSSNIDQVAIMYKTDQHHGNWVAFSTPNTKSYTWSNIDVGNTTNTQFYIEIIAYETGKGSTTAFGNYFTINQKPDAPPPPTNTQTAYPTQPPSGANYYYIPTSQSANNGTARWSPTLTPTPTPRPLSIYTVRWSEMFWFSGSMTTNLSKIADPKNVTNFIIDTKYGWQMSYEETLDLTDSGRVRTLRDIQKYWVVATWDIWIKEEWWIAYKEPATMEFKNENLTGFAPQMKVSESGQKNPGDLVKIKESKAGVVKAEVLGSARISVEPRVSFAQESYETEKTATELPVKTSHTNLKYSFKINGQERLLKTGEINKDSGQFLVTVNNLSQGSNLVQVYYQEGDKPQVLADEVTVNVILTWRKLLRPGALSLGALLPLGIATLLARRLSLSNLKAKRPKHKKR